MTLAEFRNSVRALVSNAADLPRDELVAALTDAADGLKPQAPPPAQKASQPAQAGSGSTQSTKASPSTGHR